jgi:hypothetical protein
MSTRATNGPCVAQEARGDSGFLGEALPGCGIHVIQHGRAVDRHRQPLPQLFIRGGGEQVVEGARLGAGES